MFSGLDFTLFIFLFLTKTAMMNDHDNVDPDLRFEPTLSILRLSPRQNLLLL